MAKSQGVHQASRARDLVTIVSRSLPQRGTAVLAVSGGVDSMCLLHAAARARETTRCDLVVATFDHCSGAHSSRAVAFVARAASGFRLPAVIGRGPGSARSESAWREARWNFLRSVSERVRGPVLTAHNRDDQIETVLMRALRGAGARGLAGLRAASPVRRPFLELSRAELNAYASEHAIDWMDDPSNQSLRYLRNRVRREILPALLQVRPELGEELIGLGERAARWRNELATIVESVVQLTLRRDERGLANLSVRLADLRVLGEDALRVVWPELASRLGVTLDRRGMTRATQLTLEGGTGARVQLSGGWELTRSRESIELRALGRESDTATPVKLVAPMTWASWRFTTSASSRSEGHEHEDSARDSWRADLPRDTDLQIRQWLPGDRMSIRRGNQLARRKVKYLLSDARISGHIRASWPVVLAGDEILWIPGVRRSDAATARSGGPVVTYVCDYLDRRP